MLSFDVTSFFTNISQEETSIIAIGTIFENQPSIKFTRKDIQKLFKIATFETQFTFNTEIYDQVVTMKKIE